MLNYVFVALASALCGGLIVWLFLRSGAAVAQERASRIPVLEEQIQSRLQELSDAREKGARLAADLDAERKQSVEKLALLVEAKQALTEQFQNLANQIFDDKSAKFVLQSEQTLNGILQPLRDRLTEFKAKVEEVYVNETKERFSLQSEIGKLVALNAKIGEDAVNLTNALKGNSKAQGNWGELVLERVLEGSGLVKGREYDVQTSFNKDDGGRSQPDVIVRLPEGKNIVIDSKVSLTAYDEFCSADSEEARAEALARHVVSVRAHIAGLSEKKYQSLYGIKSLDFVLLFMPIEPAFMVAVQADRDLYMNAFKKNIMVVGPWNLLISLKTIASIWQYEYQNRNTQELARQCAALYDKFAGFVADLEDVGKKIDGARGSYDAALGKLSTGKGNLVRQVERIRQLGVKPSKMLPPMLVESALEHQVEEEAGENPRQK